MLPLALALGSSLAWGVADFLGGLKSRRLALPAVLLLSQVVGLVIVAVAVVATGQPLASSATMGWAALSGVADLIGLLAFYRGLSLGAMSVVAPVAATAAVIPAGVGLASGERPSAAALAGIVLAVVGVALAGRSEPEPGRALGRGVGLALVAAVCFGLGFVALDSASDGGVGFTLLANRLGSVLIMLMVWGIDARAGDFAVESGDGLYTSRVAARPSLTGVGLGDYAALLAIGVLDLCAIGLFALASTQGMVSVVAAVGSLYPVATVVLARLLLGERMTSAQLAGVSVAMLGVLAISAG